MIYRSGKQMLTKKINHIKTITRKILPKHKEHQIERNTCSIGYNIGQRSICSMKNEDQERISPYRKNQP